jgi:hypothetical protein
LRLVAFDCFRASDRVFTGQRYVFSSLAWLLLIGFKIEYVAYGSAILFPFLHL